jgi:malonyl-CoA O-methyltransferase
MKNLKKRMNKIQHCFNRAASTYDQYSYPQQMIGNKLIELVLKHRSSADYIMDLGCGSGIITETLIQKLKNKITFALDMSEGLLKKAKNRLAHLNIQFYKYNFDHLKIKKQTLDLIFSNLALHWSMNFHNILRLVNHGLRDNGLFAFTVPLEDTFIELTAFSKNTFLKKEEVFDGIKQAGFLPLECEHDTLIFHFDSVLEAIRSIKATGSNGLFARKNKGLSNSSFCKKQYSQIMLKKPVTLTYEIGYFVGKKVSS